MGRQTGSGVGGGGLSQIARGRFIRLSPAKGPFDDAGILFRFAPDHDLFCRAWADAAIIEENAVFDGQITPQLAHDPKIASGRAQTHGATGKEHVCFNIGVQVDPDDEGNRHLVHPPRCDIKGRLGPRTNGGDVVLTPEITAIRCPEFCTRRTARRAFAVVTH